MAVRQVLGAGATPLHGTMAATWMASGTAAPGLGDGALVLGDGGAGARGRGPYDDPCKRSSLVPSKDFLFRRYG